ncbi:hypothetical protein [Flavobacterium alkalisoli]|uniref:hypothetical protein n=1 Tax=Flavobacterium alkalisoli TaxID=2602769 RepID=UPI003A916F93
MEYTTLGKLEELVRGEVDMLEDSFVTPDEFKNYVNQAIKICEKKIILLHEDYLLRESDEQVVDGNIPLPVDMAGIKIRQFNIFKSGQWQPITRLKHLSLINDVCGTKYIILNNPNEAPMAKLVGETNATKVKFMYIRKANQVVASDDLIDLPEAHNFIYHYCKMKCLQKERDPQAEIVKAEVKQLMSDLTEFLNSMVDDEGDDLLIMDDSFYDDFDSDYF